ncbi:MAG: hypothetical protein LBD21_05605 [Tannerellaceae bacterium]|nr:hypothetical protein [Tannerellaceae bacterium]
MASIYCYSNQLTSLNVTGLNKLKELHCYGNHLTSLNLTGSPVTDFIGDRQTANLTMTLNGSTQKYEITIALNKPTYLENGLSYANGKLIADNSSIDSTSFTVETGLLGKTLYGTLYLKYEAATQALYNTGDIAVINAMIDKNGLKLTKAPTDGSSVPANWKDIAVWSTEQTNRRVTELDVHTQGLTGAMDISGLKNLQSLRCSYNLLTSLNVSGLTALNMLVCVDNKLTALDVSGLSSLTSIYCGLNQLTTLDVSGLKQLEALYCNDNQLTSLNVSGLSALRTLGCNFNNLTALNLAGLQLTEYKGDNQFLDLPMTGNSAGQKYEASIALNNPTGLRSGISYAGGKLISNSDTLYYTDFTVQTGLAGRPLSGRLFLEYSTGNSNEDVSLPTLKAVSEGGRLVISGLYAGDNLSIYNLSGILIYNVKADAAEVRVDIEPGVYIIASGKRSLKVAVK